MKVPSNNLKKNYLSAKSKIDNAIKRVINNSSFISKVNTRWNLLVINFIPKKKFTTAYKVVHLLLSKRLDYK